MRSMSLAWQLRVTETTVLTLVEGEGYVKVDRPNLFRLQNIRAFGSLRLRMFPWNLLQVLESKQIIKTEHCFYKSKWELGEISQIGTSYTYIVYFGTMRSRGAYHKHDWITPPLNP